MRTENANRARMIGNLNIDFYEPYPKNPKIAKFFKEIGLADELGSGIKNIVKYTRIYSGGTPEFKEDDVFRTIIPLESADKTPINADKTPIKLNIEEMIIKYLHQNEYITNKILKEKYKLKDTKAKEILRDMVLKDILISEGANKNRRYRLNKSNEN